MKSGPPLAGRETLRFGKPRWDEGALLFHGGRFVDAVEWERRAVELRPNFGTAWRTLATSAGITGDLEVAANALAVAEQLHPSLSIEWVEKYHPIVHARDRLIYIEGLRAGASDSAGRHRRLSCQRRLWVNSGRSSHCARIADGQRPNRARTGHSPTSATGPNRPV